MISASVASSLRARTSSAEQLGDVFADHVDAEQLAVLGVEDQLDEAVGLARRQRAAADAEGELADLDLAAVLSRAFFSVMPMLATCGCV